MKTKSRPVKRKSSEDLSMECDKRDISKKHRIASSHIFLDVDTMSTSHDFLQLSPKACTSAESSDHSLYVLANANDNGNGTKPTDKPIGTNIGLPLQNTTAEVTPRIQGLPMEDNKRDMRKKYQTTYPCILLDMNTASSNDTKLLAAKDYRNKDETHKYQLTDKSIGRNIGLPIGNNKPEVATQMIIDRQRPIIYDDQSHYPKHQTTKKRRNPHWYRSRMDPVGTQYLGGESISISNRILAEYNHLGQCTSVCRHCGAMFWECEKVASTSRACELAYNKCCYGGRIILRPPPEYPQHIKELYESTHFMDNIRAYNQMFSMTSLGANVDNSVNNGKGPYVFRISGQIYHWIGSLCPEQGQSPRVFALYIYDTTNEVKNRMAHFGNEHKSELKEEIVEHLIEFLDNHNALVQLFRTARNKYLDADIPEFKVRLYNVIGTRRYELPTSETVCNSLCRRLCYHENEFDLIIEEHSRFPQRVSKLHPCYMSLQFPLLFLYGEDGYQKDMKLANVPGQSTKANKRMSMNMYYSYQIHDRLNHHNLLLRGGKLFQQYVVTAYCAIEQSRLDYIRQKQDDIRSEYLSGIYDAILRGDRDGSDLGLRTVLTASFTGSPRYMYAHYLDALANCRYKGSPPFLNTFTCNAKWPEIEEFMEPFPQLTTADRADIVDLLYTIEFQKRGLPHCHSLLWIDAASRVQQDVDVDKYVCAELPDPTTDTNAFAIISELMIHGPCGYANPSATCMKDDIRKINNKIYPTNKAACQALGLLSGDEEWVTAFQEASLFATSLELRRLFVYILIFCNVSDPMKLWHKLWKDLSDDIPRKLSKTLRIPQIERNEKKLKASVLFDLEHMLNAYSKSLKDFGLPMPPEDMLLILQNRLLMEETRN
ncbi:DNA helicase [Tanacetum coccineum]